MAAPVITASVPRFQVYTATAGQTDFPIAWAYLEEAGNRVEVWRAGVQIAAYIGGDGDMICDPAVDGELVDGVAGTATIPACQLNDTVVMFARTTPERDVRYTNPADTTRDNLNREMNRRVAVEVELREDLARTLRLPVGEDVAAAPAPVEGGVLGWLNGAWDWLTGLPQAAVSSFMQSALLVSSAHAFAKLVDGSLTLATYAAFTALSGKASNVTYRILGGETAGDGAEGDFRYNPAATNTPVAGVILANDGGGNGRGFRLGIRGVLDLAWATRGQVLGTAQASLVDQRAAYQELIDYAYVVGLPIRSTLGKRVYAVSKSPSGNYCLNDPGISQIGVGSPDSDFSSQIVPMTGVTSGVDIVRIHPAAGTIDRPIWDGIRINQAYGGSPLGRHGVYALYDNVSTSLMTEWRNCRFTGGNDASFKTDNVDLTNPQGVPFAPRIKNCYIEGLHLRGCADSSEVEGCVLRRSGNGYALTYDPVNGGAGIPQKAHIHKINIDGPILLASGIGTEIYGPDQEVSTGTNTAALEIAAGCEDVMIAGWTFGVFGTGSLTAVLKNAGTRTKMRDCRIDTAPSGGGFTPPTYGIWNDAGGSLSIDMTTVWIRSGRFGTDIYDPGNGISYVWQTPNSVDNTLPRFDGAKGKLQTSGVVVSDTDTILGGVGAAATPTFGVDTGLGFYKAGSGQIGLASGAANQWNLGQNFLSVNGGKILVGNGLVGGPSLTFANSATNGLYLIGSNNVGMAINGALSVDYSATRTKYSQPIELQSYTVATLPTVGAARVAYASNGRKAGEGSGAGTGVQVFCDATAWRAVDTGATVAA